VTLAWDPVTASGLAGYRVHYGTASRNYSSVAGVGNQTTATITGLTAGTSYYFAATAYDTAGTESAFSNEVVYIAPSSCSPAISPGTVSVPAAGGTGSVTVSTSSICSWTTANLASWVTITSGASGTGNGTVTYSVSANTGSASRTTNLTIAGVIFNVIQTGAPTSTYTITASDSAGFTQTPTACTLAITTNGSGRGTVTRSPSAPTFPAGTVVTLTAVPGWSSAFSGWSGACTGTSTTCTLTMTSDTSVTATFNAQWIWGWGG